MEKNLVKKHPVVVDLADSPYLRLLVLENLDLLGQNVKAPCFMKSCFSLHIDMLTIVVSLGVNMSTYAS